VQTLQFTQIVLDGLRKGRRSPRVVATILSQLPSGNQIPNNYG
jgi:hypothetical protein